MTARSSYDIDRFVVGVRFGEEVRALRKRRGMSQKQLADAMGVTPPFVCDLEKGRHGPSEERLQQIAKILRTSAKHLRKAAGICQHCAGSGIRRLPGATR